MAAGYTTSKARAHHVRGHDGRLTQRSEHTAGVAHGSSYWTKRSACRILSHGSLGSCWQVKVHLVVARLPRRGWQACQGNGSAQDATAALAAAAARPARSRRWLLRPRRRRPRMLLAHLPAGRRHGSARALLQAPRLAPPPHPPPRPGLAPWCRRALQGRQRLPPTARALPRRVRCPLDPRQAAPGALPRRPPPACGHAWPPGKGTLRWRPAAPAAGPQPATGQPRRAQQQARVTGGGSEGGRGHRPPLEMCNMAGKVLSSQACAQACCRLLACGCGAACCCAASSCCMADSSSSLPRLWPDSALPLPPSEPASRAHWC